MGAFSSTMAGVVAPAEQITMAQGGSSGSQKKRPNASTSRSLSSIPVSEACRGPESMAVMDVDGNEVDSMMCDMSGPENCAINAAKEVLSKPRDTSTFTSQFSDQFDFTNYAMSVLNSGEVSVFISDNVRYCLLSIVQYLEKAVRAMLSERTASVEVHHAEISQMMAECEKKATEAQDISEAKMKELSTRLERASKEHSEALSQLRRVQTSLTASQTELQDCKKRTSDLQAEVKEKTAEIEKSNTKTAELEKKLRLSQAATDASAKEVQRLNTAVTQKEKAVKEMAVERNLLMTKCTKAEEQIALIEQKAAQESLNSGSYADDRANPSMLQDVACKSVDKATDALTKILHEYSITKSRYSEAELDHFVRCICPAKLGDFARPLHVKYVWSYKICSVMFRGFEHCFFDADGGKLTSPLDAKVHASNSFESYQLIKATKSVELYEKCDMFRTFCTKKYAEMFPPTLLKAALFSFYPGDNISFDACGRFSGDATIFNCFLDVAKAVWLLHELAFAFDPPVSILRMAFGEVFDKRFQESVVHDEDRGGGTSKVVLMIRPAFRVRNTIIRSRVFRANV